jgi:hypothetical protein
VLDAHTVEAVARRVVEIIEEAQSAVGARRLVDAATLARALGVKRAWVYEHCDDLGAVRLGTGSKPRLRFDVHVARGALVRLGGVEEMRAEGIPTDAGNAARRNRRGRRTKGSPSPGRVLASRPRAVR